MNYPLHDLSEQSLLEAIEANTREFLLVQPQSSLGSLEAGRSTICTDGPAIKPKKPILFRTTKTFW